MYDHNSELEELTTDQLQHIMEQPGAAPQLTLLDVRQPGEYRAGHLPGALLIPLTELVQRLDELDPKQKVVVYCAAGVRSRAAGELLLRHGFRLVAHLPAGYSGWRGLVARGLPEVDLSCFRSLTTPEQHVALAAKLEQGAQQFYQRLAEKLSQPVAGLFASLVEDEERHMETLRTVYEALTMEKPAANFPKDLLLAELPEDLMEGGYRWESCLDLIDDNDGSRACEIAMSVEVNAYDHYLYLQRQVADENCQRVFEVLAEEERRHLLVLSRKLDILVAPTE